MMMIQSPKKSCYVQANAAEQGTEKCCRLFVKAVFETTFYHLSPLLYADKTFNKIKRFTNKVRFINKNTKWVYYVHSVQLYLQYKAGTEVKLDKEKFFRNITLAESFGIENISNVPYC